MKSKLSRCLIVAAGFAAISLPLLAQQNPAPIPSPAPATQNVDPNKVVLVVGDEKMTAKDFNDFVSDLPPQYQQMAQQPASRRRLADELVNYMLMANEAKKRGLDQSPKFQRQMRVARDQILAATLAADLQTHSDDGALQKYYDEHKGEFETVKARHILIRTAGSRIPLEGGKKELTDEQAKAKALEIRARLAKGEDFATIAKAESDDKSTAVQGGDLGQQFGRAQFDPQHRGMVKPFEEATFALKPAEISQPIKTEFGYHIIQLQEKNTPTFAQMKDELSAKLGPEKLDALIADLKKDQKPMVDESFFGKPPSTQPTMPPGTGAVVTRPKVMPRIIDYPTVLEQMRGLGLKSLYHNSGAFGFTDPSRVRHVGWIGPPDSTLRPAAIALTRSVPPPYESNLANLATRLWQQSLPGALWLMPKSHWAYELDVNNPWLAPALESIGLDPASLIGRNTGEAVEFAANETEAFSVLCQRLLEMLSTSDFFLAFPPHRVCCTLHHHKQLWWSTTDDAIHAAIDLILPAQP